MSWTWRAAGWRIMQRRWLAAGARTTVCTRSHRVVTGPAVMISRGKRLDLPAIHHPRPMTPSCRLSSGPAPSAAPTSLAQASVAFEESSKRMAMADEAKGKSRELSGGGGPDQLRCQVGAHTGSAPGGCPQTGWASLGPSAPQAADKQCTESLPRTTYPTQRGGRGSRSPGVQPWRAACVPRRSLRRLTTVHQQPRGAAKGRKKSTNHCPPAAAWCRKGAQKVAKRGKKFGRAPAGFEPVPTSFRSAVRWASCYTAM